MNKTKYLPQFKELVRKPVPDQAEFFLKSFIFALDDQWKEVNRLSNVFVKYVDDLPNTDEKEKDYTLNEEQAADFLQKNGRARTALQRRAEIKDIDLDADNRISFTEYCILHFKDMVLKSYYARHEKQPEEDLSNGALGITGVGEKLLEELFTMPTALDPALEAAIEEFTAKKKEREVKLKDLSSKAAAGGVKGIAAANEIKQMESADATEMNRLELTLNAAKKKAGKKSGEAALQEKQKKEEKEQKAKMEAGRNKISAMRSQWEKDK